MLKNRPLYIFLWQMDAHRRDFDKTKYMSFLVNDDEFGNKNWNRIWEKI